MSSADGRDERRYWYVDDGMQSVSVGGGFWIKVERGALADVQCLRGFGLWYFAQVGGRLGLDVAFDVVWTGTRMLAPGEQYVERGSEDASAWQAPMAAHRDPATRRDLLGAFQAQLGANLSRSA